MLLAIAIPIKFDNVSGAKPKEKSAKKCVACSEFLFCLLNLPLLHFLNFIIAGVPQQYCLVIVWLIIIMLLASLEEPQQWWNWGNEEEMKWKNDGNEEWNQHPHVPTQRLVIVFQEMGEWQGGQAGGEGGRGDMPKIPPLSHHRQAKLKIYKWVNPWHYSKNGCITAVERATN